MSNTMHFRVANWQWTCTYCRRHPLQGDELWFISESTEHCKGPWTVFFDRDHCPKERCPWCKSAPLAYPFHLHCLGTIHQFFQGHKILEVNDWRLRCAEVLSSDPVVQDQQPSTPRSLIEAFHELFEEIESLLAPETPLRTLLRKLYALPPELQELVFSFSLDYPGGVFFIDKSTLNALQTLIAWPEQRHRRLLCNGSLFARWVTSGSKSYIAGLYDEHIPGSFPVKADDEQWNLAVVTWSGSRITKIGLVRSDSALATACKPDFVQIVHRPTHGNFWITIQGLFVSRIDSSDGFHPRILWSSCTPLQCSDLPEHDALYMITSNQDVAATCLTLEDMSGISVAHCNGHIEVVHVHRKNLDSSHIYQQAHNFVTWMYCPINSEEALVGIWLVHHSSTGTGLIVAWLCPYISQDSPRSIRTLASAATRAIYHSSCMKVFGSIPAITHHCAAPHWISQCSTPEFPSLLQGHCHYQWSFSTASLDNVQAVRVSRKGGIELRYEGFRQCLGDFRPSEALDWYENPDYFKVSRIAETHYAIRFFKKKDQNTESGLCPLAGRRIIFWSDQDSLIIEVKDSF